MPPVGFAGDGTRALAALLAQALTALRALKAALAAAGPGQRLHPHVAAVEAGWADFQACIYLFSQDGTRVPQVAPTMALDLNRVTSGYAAAAAEAGARAPDLGRELAAPGVAPDAGGFAGDEALGVLSDRVAASLAVGTLAADMVCTILAALPVVGERNCVAIAAGAERALSCAALQAVGAARRLEGAGLVVPLWRVSAGSIMEGAGALVLLPLRLEAQGRAGVAAALRQGPLRPEGLLGLLRTQASVLGSLGDEERDAGVASMGERALVVSLSQLYQQAMMAPELAAVKRDAGLQAALLAALLRPIRRVAALGAARSPHATSLYHNAARALQHLGCGMMSEVTISGDPGEAAEVMLGVLGSLMRRAPPPDAWPSHPNPHAAMLGSAASVLGLLAAGPRGRLLSPAQALAAVRAAAESVEFLIHHASAGYGGYMGIAMRDFGGLSDAFLARAQPAREAMPTLLEAMAAADAWARLAVMTSQPELRAGVLARGAGVPASGPELNPTYLDLALKQSWALMSGSSQIACQGAAARGGAPLHDALSGLAPLLHTWSKLALQLAALRGGSAARHRRGAWPGEGFLNRQGTAPVPFAALQGGLWLLASALESCFDEDDDDWEGVDPELMLRWRGSVLAACAAAEALPAGAAMADLGADPELPWGLLLLFAHILDGRTHGADTACVARAARLCMDLSFAQPPQATGTLQHKVLQVLSRVYLEPGTAMALMRSGLLSPLARWAQRQAQQARQQARQSADLPPADQAALGLVEGVVSLAAQVAAVVAHLPGPRIAYLEITARRGARHLADPAFWEELRKGVVDELEVGLAASAAAEDPEDAAAEQLASAVEGTRALAALQCGNPACTMVFPVPGAGVKEASRKRCSSCLLVRYCGASCQRAHWRAHKAPCRELLRRREEQDST